MQLCSEPAARILEIEARQDEALRLLAELEQRTEQVLAESLVVSSRSIAIAASHVELFRAA
jgi:hypothetical protein